MRLWPSVVLGSHFFWELCNHHWCLRNCGGMNAADKTAVPTTMRLRSFRWLEGSVLEIFVKMRFPQKVCINILFFFLSAWWNVRSMRGMNKAKQQEKLKENFCMKDHLKLFKAQMLLLSEPKMRLFFFHISKNEKKKKETCQTLEAVSAVDLQRIRPAFFYFSVLFTLIFNHFSKSKQWSWSKPGGPLKGGGRDAVWRPSPWQQLN